mgnify:CR=1 FL=1
MGEPVALVRPACVRGYRHMLGCAAGKRSWKERERNARGSRERLAGSDRGAAFPRTRAVEACRRMPVSIEDGSELGAVPGESCVRRGRGNGASAVRWLPDMVMRSGSATVRAACVSEAWCKSGLRSMSSSLLAKGSARAGRYRWGIRLTIVNSRCTESGAGQARCAPLCRNRYDSEACRGT